MRRTTRITIGLLALFAISLTSCKEKPTNQEGIDKKEKSPTQDEIVKKNIEEYLKSKMNDPASYEFVKLELIDSVLFSNNIEYRKDYFNRNMESDQNSLERQERYKIEIPSMFNKKEVADLKANIEKNRRILEKIDSIATQLGERTHEVASYKYVFTFRGNNAFGAKILNEYIVQTDPSPDFKIINMTDDKDKIYLNPNDFPGYREMIVKNL